MKVTAIETRLIEAKLQKPMGGSAARPPVTSRKLAIVLIRTDEGLVGIGESYGPPETVAASIKEMIAPQLLGRSVFDGSALADIIKKGIGYHGPKGVVWEAMSAVDTALWDLRGKFLSAPLSHLVGGPVHEHVDVYAASVYLGDEAFAEEQASYFKAEGFTDMKLKVGQGPREDIANMKRVRAVAGDDARIMTDANGSYDRKTALHVGSALSDLGAFWFEEPVNLEDLEGYRYLQRALPCYLAGGEGEYTRHGFRSLLLKGRPDVVQPDITRCGGVTESLAIAALASVERSFVSFHCWGSIFGLAASLHLASTFPHTLMLEYDAHPHPLRDAIIPGQLLAKEGRCTVPSGPGLGLEVDMDALERLTVFKAVSDLK